MNCLSCEYDTFCCSKFGVTLSRKEIAFYKKKKLVPLIENGIIIGYVFVLKRSKETGACIYQNNKNGLCSVYDNRPDACREFNCK